MIKAEPNSVASALPVALANGKSGPQGNPWLLSPAGLITLCGTATRVRDTLARNI
jgi:hypothetical protein